MNSTADNVKCLFLHSSRDLSHIYRPNNQRDLFTPDWKKTPSITLESTHSTLATAQHHTGNHPQHNSIVFRKTFKSSLIYFCSNGINGVYNAGTVAEIKTEKNDIGRISPSKPLISQVKCNSINVLKYFSQHASHLVYRLKRLNIISFF